MHIKIRFISLFMLVVTLIAQTDDAESLTKGMSTGSYRPMFLDMSNPPIPIASEIDPAKYLLEPGDQFHVIVTSLESKRLPGREYDLFNAETVEYYEFIDPTGGLTLPSIGQFSTTGKTYQQIKDEISTAAQKMSYTNIQTIVHLAVIRSFKVRVMRAVEYPGYVVMTSVSRVKDAIDETKGVQKYGSSEVAIIERDGFSQNLFLKEFLLMGDLSQNPILKEGDAIIISFMDAVQDEPSNFMEYKTSQIIVHGFVHGPQRSSYVPGYKVNDYIAMVGGVLNTGSRTRIYRADGTVLNRAYDEYIEPGDVAVVPENLCGRLSGNISILQTAATVATLILTYQATIGTV